MNRIGSHRFVIFLTVALFSLFAYVPANAVAQDDATPAIVGTPQPSNPDDTIWFVIAPDGKSNGDYFDVQLAAGESATLKATIGNGSEIPVKAIMYAADAYSGANGGLILSDSTQSVSAPTTWLDFPTTTREFQPKESFEASFTVSVPADAPPGQYITGIAVETADAAPMPGTAPLLVKYRLISAVLITVPGTVTPGFELGDISIATDEQTTTITGQIHNTGNIRVRPEGTLTVTDSSGSEVVNAPIAMGSVYAGDETTYQILLPSPLAEGTYTASVDLKDPDTGATASIGSQDVTVAKPVAPAPVSITNVTIAPMPSADNVVFAQVSVTIGNTGSPLSGGEVTLQVFRDGKQVDDHVLGTAMIIQNGDSTVDQTYIPESGKWEPGTYTFQVTLTTTDLTSGTTSTVATVMSDQTIVVK